MTPDQETLAIAGAIKAFRGANPEFRRRSQTLEEMAEYIDEHGLPTTDAESWQKAYDFLCRESVSYVPGNFREDGTLQVYSDREAIDLMPTGMMKDKLDRDPMFARGVNLTLRDAK